jgi:hypothetical protein
MAMVLMVNILSGYSKQLPVGNLLVINQMKITWRCCCRDISLISESFDEIAAIKPWLRVTAK